ncbi:peptidoglycan-binding protein [Streptomyces sp. DSM 3412]|uniref:Peptidoglycan-binding protein n=1 Tax=Streptomyces gottesmaniae TaxID=3075518 RepID=A0ABU2Z9P5_9ACTN|nr:peptidoglycan-binding protein [Streptomyces sp. DSM 3412]MDT0572823.1 peptidoglycan-binding protein [Streptomyces sp. DSM 3412]
METPVFEEIDPGADCDCPGCVHWRRVMPYSTQYAHLSHPAARTARNALVVATAAGAALGAAHAVPAVAAAHGPAGPGVVPAGEEPKTPQGKKAPLHGPGGRPAGGEKPPKGVTTPPTTRAEIIERAEKWIADEVPYSMREYWSDGYRQDCSGFVSMAWNLPGNEWTGSLDKFAQRISKDRLEPGDMLLFHNPKDPHRGSHVVLFGGWTDHTETHYIAYESARPYARRQATPYGYWNNATRYVPYRYKGLIPDGAGSSGDGTDAANGSDDSDGSTGGFEGAGAPAAPADRPGAKGSAGASGGDRFPGAAAFGPGARNKHVARLGQMLVARGGARFYTDGPGPIWSDADRRATRAFQRAQGWSGRHADGIPGPLTWSYLVTGRGRDIPPAPAGSPGPKGTPAIPPRPPVVHRPTGRPGGPGPSASTGSPVRPGTPEAPETPKSPAAPVTPASHGVLGYPGRAMFRPGADNVFVTRLGKRLVEKGFGKYYTSGPGPRWGESDRRNVEAFQRAQGWRGGAADGYPGPETWRRLFS